MFTPPEGFWGTHNFWAPEVHTHQGKYYLLRHSLPQDIVVVPISLSVNLPWVHFFLFQMNQPHHWIGSAWTVLFILTIQHSLGLSSAMNGCRLMMESMCQEIEQ